ncbi:uncharacterized protein LOC144616000 [Panthera onca]
MRKTLLTDSGCVLAPHTTRPHPAQLSTLPSRGKRLERGSEELPTGSPALSLDLPIETASKFGGLDRGRPLLLLPKGQTPLSFSATHASTRAAPAPQTPVLCPPRPESWPLGPFPRTRTPPLPLPRLQMAAPRVGLEAPRRRPAAAGGRSLPPSQLLRQRPGWTALRGRQAPALALIGTGAPPRRGTREPRSRGSSFAGPRCSSECPTQQP